MTLTLWGIQTDLQTIVVDGVDVSVQTGPVDDIVPHAYYDDKQRLLIALSEGNHEVHVQESSSENP